MANRDRLPSVNDFELIDDTENYIVVSKPAPLVVHPTDKSGQPSLLCGVQQFLCYEIALGSTLSIITRLDRETSGLVLIAKNKTTARAFSRAMERREVKKSYLAIIEGSPDWDKKIVDAPIGNFRDVAESKIWLKQSVHEKGRESITHFEVVTRFHKYSLVRVVPKTGRMHQIRVHAAFLGHPLIGDKIYGPNQEHYLNHMEYGWTDEMAHELKLPRHALHAESLEVYLDKELLSWEAKLADDLKHFLYRKNK